MKAPRLVWELAGCPPVEGGSAKLFTDTESLCAMCGQVQDRTAPADKVLGQNFTDRGLFMAPHAPRVCWGCVSICSGSPPRTWRQWTVVATPSRHLPPSQEKAGAWLGQNFGLCLTSKKDTSPVIDTLLDPPDGPWVVSIAESGQKHVLPYADVNYGNAGFVRMETVNIAYMRNTFRKVFYHALAIRRLGVPSEAVLRGEPRFLKTREALETWREHQKQLAPYTNSPMLALVLWCITKGIIENDRY